MNDKRRQTILLTLAGAAGLGAALGWRWWTQPKVGAAEMAGLWASEFETPAGEPLPLKLFKDRPLVVNFWATWCPPCVAEMPLLDAFFQQSAAKGWQVLGLAIDQPSQVRRFLTQRPVRYPIALAGLGGPELGRQLGNESGALPFTLVLRPDGSVLQSKLGKLSEDDIAGWSKAKI